MNPEIYLMIDIIIIIWIPPIVVWIVNKMFGEK